MNSKNYLFTSESVSEGHPDKVADQISDAILDKFLAFDPKAHVACETLVTTGQVMIAGEVTTDVYIDLQRTAREMIEKIGYTKSEYQFDANSCGILNSVHEQSGDIKQGVDKADDNQADQGAGDQGMMFGYACNETPNLMPLTLDLAHALMRELADIRHNHLNLMPYLRPDSKAQVTVEYDGDTHRPVHVDTIVVSTQHDEDVDRDRIEQDVKAILIPRTLEHFSEDIRALIDSKTRYKVNPTGKFVIGGPHGDTGLTGRKIIVDTYGGRGAHGGGAFSGKDPSKVDRSAAYACRHIAKNVVAAGIADEVLVQVAYAIGVAEPVSFYVNTYGTSHVDKSDAEIAAVIKGMKDEFDMRPAAIIKRLKLLNPIYTETAAYGHMGRKCEVVHKKFESLYNETAELDVELFTWEKLDRVDALRAAFNLK
ncbi:MAG: methionine adenosyltransferase [Muribaculaceae bacterium]|jgi:S-adenosylmethionine synthetase|nr:methionine adenosyltransferase [Muribaculaceae bacterium]